MFRRVFSPLNFSVPFVYLEGLSYTSSAQCGAELPGTGYFLKGEMKKRLNRKPSLAIILLSVTRDTKMNCEPQPFHSVILQNFHVYKLEPFNLTDISKLA